MEARKKKAPAKKSKLKPSHLSAAAVKQILDEKIKLYEEKQNTSSMAQEPMIPYEKNKPNKQEAASSNKEIAKKLRALKELIGIAPGLWLKDGEDAQAYVNRLRANDRF